jgi:alpha-aminoadipate carrier protein LysW
VAWKANPPDKLEAAYMTAHPNSQECTVCGANFQLDENPLLNELIECADCGTEFEVTSVEPLTLALAPQEEEDWGE